MSGTAVCLWELKHLLPWSGVAGELVVLVFVLAFGAAIPLSATPSQTLRKRVTVSMDCTWISLSVVGEQVLPLYSIAISLVCWAIGRMRPAKYMSTHIHSELRASPRHLLAVYTQSTVASFPRPLWPESKGMY